MTGPEAIAAAERLLVQLRECSMNGPDSVDLVLLAVESADTLATLRSALLQSQEALQLIANGTILMRPEAVAKAALLSPPVAPKER